MSQKSLCVSELTKYRGEIDKFDKTQAFLQSTAEFIAHQDKETGLHPQLTQEQAEHYINLERKNRSTSTMF